jgi:hypothetical protein
MNAYSGAGSKLTLGPSYGVAAFALGRCGLICLKRRRMLRDLNTNTNDRDTQSGPPLEIRGCGPFNTFAARLR